MSNKQYREENSFPQTSLGLKLQHTPTIGSQKCLFLTICSKVLYKTDRSVK